MVGNEPNYVEALVIDSDSIVFVGDFSESKQLIPSARKVNLNGKTLLAWIYRCALTVCWVS